MHLKSCPITTPIPLKYVGPDIGYAEENHQIPCIIYLALSANESLLTDPYNQPVSFLWQKGARIFSADLPFHGENMPATDAMKRWAEDCKEKQGATIKRYIEDLAESLKILFQTLHPSKIAIAGLSRGGFMASHIALRLQEIPFAILLFAPLTLLKHCEEFTDLSIPDPLRLDTLEALSVLSQKKIRTYIGNRDTRVSTDACYSWYRMLVEEAYITKRLRSPPIELIIKPSLGYLGHGTAKSTFEEGSSWLLQ